jgi:hypothetical protein
MNTVLWVLQWITGLLFVFAGFSHTLTPAERLTRSMPWVEQTGIQTARVAGVTEFLGGLGLILPGLFDIATWLIPVAGFGLVLQMILAARLHTGRKEPQAVAINAVLGLLALAVAVGRLLVPL